MKYDDLIGEIYMKYDLSWLQINIMIRQPRFILTLSITLNIFL